MSDILPTLQIHELLVPSLIANQGSTATKSFLEFFAADIRNPRTRQAYLIAINRFSTWCDVHGLNLKELQPYHIGAYVEAHTKQASPPTVKQHLAAIRRLLDFLVLQQVIHSNPAKSVRGIKHVIRRGKTPIPSNQETQELLLSIPNDTIIGLRDRALIGLLLYSFSRVTAAISLKVEDYFPQGKRFWLRLHEKGGRYHEMPVHHRLEEYLDAYIDAAGLKAEPKSPLFRTSYKRTGLLNEHGMSRQDVYSMVQRRAKVAGIATDICCHSFRARGITTYLENGGTLENAQKMAAHASPETTKLYDRTEDAISLDEVERIIL
jgi:site-specific recombinase XerD